MWSGAPSRRDRGCSCLFGVRREWMSASLREALDLFVGSETFEGLLLAQDRPIHARAETGEAFVVAGPPVALAAHVVSVGPGPPGGGAPVEGIAAVLPCSLAL